MLFAINRPRSSFHVLGKTPRHVHPSQLRNRSEVGSTFLSPFERTSRRQATPEGGKRQPHSLCNGRSHRSVVSCAPYAIRLKPKKVHSTISEERNGKYLLRSRNILDRRTGHPFSVELKGGDDGFTFSSDEDREVFAACFSAHRAAADPNSMLDSFMDSFWEMVRNKYVFRAYTQSDVRRLIGGVSEIDWYACRVDL